MTVAEWPQSSLEFPYLIKLSRPISPDDVEVGMELFSVDAADS